MTQLTVFIHDQIRDEHIRLKLDVNRHVSALIDDLIDKFGLPRRNFSPRPLKYQLVRASTGQSLLGNKNLYELRITNREILLLTCPEARWILETIQKYLDEIESQIHDQVTGTLKEQVTNELWKRVKQKLEYLERTQPGNPRFKLYRHWVDTVDHSGGPFTFLERIEKTLDLLNAKGIGMSLFKIGLATMLSVIVVRYTGPELMATTSEETPLSPEATSSIMATATHTPFPIASSTMTTIYTPTTTHTTVPTATFTPSLTASSTQKPTIAPPIHKTSRSTEPILTAVPTITYTPSPTAGLTLTPTVISPSPDPDSDNDGLSNKAEGRLGTDPTNPDTDEDGLLDGSGEFDQVIKKWKDNTDPLNPDTDGDGYGDGAEMKRGTNPLDPKDPSPKVTTTLRTEPAMFRGQCPTTVEFVGTITLDYFAGGEVTYIFLRNDGNKTPPQTIFFKESGSKAINTSYTLPGKIGETFTGWVAIQILEPVDYQSEPASYEVICGVPQTPPKQISPPDGSVFDHFPRTTTLIWSPNPDAMSYSVEIDCFHCCAGGKWCTDFGETWSIEPGIKTTDYTFNFVGAQPGRWRVWAVYKDQSTGPKSAWWEFVYTR